MFCLIFRILHGRNEVKQQNLQTGTKNKNDYHARSVQFVLHSNHSLTDDCIESAHIAPVYFRLCVASCRIVFLMFCLLAFHFLFHWHILLSPNK